jgi:hypothetical protein
VFPYDSSLLAAVKTDPKSISDVLTTMHAIDGLCVDVDGLKWFNWLYLQVTNAVEARVAAGGFSDPAWLAELDVQFATLYFSALRASLSGGVFSGNAPPECWQILFERRNQLPIARIQFALAGINAHINHDLPDAIVNTCVATNTTPDHGGTHYYDYTALNVNLDALIEEAKQELNVRLPGDSLPEVTHIEDTIAAWNVTAARELAWDNADRLWPIRSIPLAHDAFLDMLDGFTTVIGKALLVPAP